MSDYRCYARKESAYPNNYQFCGERRGALIHPVALERCGEHGCPGNFATPPFAIVDVRDIYRKPPPSLKLLLLLLIVVSTIFMV